MGARTCPIRLIERAGYGTTLEVGGHRPPVERAAQAASAIIELIGLIDQALLAGLPDVVEPTVAGLARRAATDTDIGQ